MSGVLFVLSVLSALAIAGLAILLRPREAWDLPEAPERIRKLRRRYERLLRALKDLEFDAQAGILAKDEHERLRAEYKRMAIGARKALDRARLAAIRAIASGKTGEVAGDERQRIEDLVAKARKGAAAPRT